MVRKKIDNRIRVLIENGVAERHRTMFVVIGDHARDQVSERRHRGSSHGHVRLKLLFQDVYKHLPLHYSCFGLYNFT